MKQLLVIIIMSLSNQMFGQNTVGVQLGGLLNLLSGTKTVGYKPGACVSITYQATFKNKIQMVLGLTYLQKGYLQISPISIDPFSSYIGSHENCIDIEYLKLPISFKFALGGFRKSNYSFQIGVYGAYRLNAKQQLMSDNKSSRDFTINVHEVDWGTNGSFNVEFPFKNNLTFTGSIVFDAGLVDVIKYIPGSRNYGCGLMFGLNYQLYGVKLPLSN
jgi:hypothetical protein